MMEKREPWLAWAMELQSLAQAGLYYGKDPFDLQRYQRIREIAAEMMSAGSGLPPEQVQTFFCCEAGYQTPKLDTRAAIFRAEESADSESRNGPFLLLVRERSGRWSLPGGWCDYDRSPADNVAKEAREEAGAAVTVKSVIAVQDRDRHNLPPYPFGVVKIFFLCALQSMDFAPNEETTEAGWFPENGLPPLAEEKCTADQIRMCFAAHRDPAWRTQFE